MGVFFKGNLRAVVFFSWREQRTDQERCLHSIIKDKTDTVEG